MCKDLGLLPSQSLRGEPDRTHVWKKLSNDTLGVWALQPLQHTPDVRSDTVISGLRRLNMGTTMMSSNQTSQSGNVSRQVVDRVG